MAEKPKRGLRVVKSKNVLTNEYIEECKALQERMLKSRGGKLMPSSVEIIRAHRDGMCVECVRDIVEVAEQARKLQEEASQMAQSKLSRKTRLSRPRRVPRKSWMEEARQVRKDILEVRGGVLVPSTAEAIREARESDQE